MWRIKMFKKLALICLCSIAIATSCTIHPHNINSVVVAYDSTTPKQYDPHNAGLLTYLTNGDAVVTSGAIDRYNYLTTNFAKKVLIEKGLTVKPNDGVADYFDQYANHLYTLDQQHMVLFLTYVAWIRSGIYQ